MADRHPSITPYVLPVAPDSPPSFTFEQLVFIRRRREEADAARNGPSAWPERRRFESMLPPAPVTRIRVA
jgi:hypothetical protein